MTIPGGPRPVSHWLLVTSCWLGLTTAVLADPNIIGTWQSDLVPSRRDSAQQMRLQVETDEAVQLLSTYYSGTEQNDGWTMSTYYDYRQTGPYPEFSKTWQLDFTVKRITIMPHTWERAQIFNFERFCGRSDWDAARERDVTGRRCFLNDRLPRRGLSIYQIYRLDRGLLTLGILGEPSPQVGYEPDRRPRYFDEAFVMGKAR